VDKNSLAPLETIPITLDLPGTLFFKHPTNPKWTKRDVARIDGDNRDHPYPVSLPEVVNGQPLDECSSGPPPPPPPTPVPPPRGMLNWPGGEFQFAWEKSANGCTLAYLREGTRFREIVVGDSGSNWNWQSAKAQVVVIQGFRIVVFHNFGANLNNVYLGSFYKDDGLTAGQFGLTELVALGAQGVFEHQFDLATSGCGDRGLYHAVDFLPPQPVVMFSFNTGHGGPCIINAQATALGWKFFNARWEPTPNPR